jgi:tetraacyldisaccharide 4'-kinase
LQEEAVGSGAMLVTTAKDWVRLSPEWRSRAEVLHVSIRWEDELALERTLARVLRH